MRRTERLAARQCVALLALFLSPDIIDLLIETSGLVEKLLGNCLVSEENEKIGARVRVSESTAKIWD
jgi:hypothetical protein